METTVEKKYTFKDFSSDQEVRWCPGCDDYVILRAMQKALPEMGVKKEDVVYICVQSLLVLITGLLLLGVGVLHTLSWKRGMFFAGDWKLAGTALERLGREYVIHVTTPAVWGPSPKGEAVPLG